MRAGRAGGRGGVEREGCRSSGGFLDEGAKGAFGVVKAGFDGAERSGGDAGDFFERKLLENVKQQDGALRERKFFDEGEDRGGLFVAENFAERIRGRGIGDVAERVVVGSGEGGIVERVAETFGSATGAAPVLHAFLMSDAEEPCGEPRIVAEA